ncbi:hypothetical protein AB68_2208 [Escherichia coli 7-233-03_S1_C3]|nr:hypothetical protein AB68_2208 [Escherichia coli 7-233-03_S1_C3]
MDLEARNSAVAHRLTELTANFTIVFLLPSGLQSGAPEDREH